MPWETPGSKQWLIPIQYTENGILSLSFVSPSVCFCMWLWWLLLFDLSGHVVFLGTGTPPTLFYPISIPSIRSHLSATAIWFHRRAGVLLLDGNGLCTFKIWKCLKQLLRYDKSVSCVSNWFSRRDILTRRSRALPRVPDHAPLVKWLLKPRGSWTDKR